MIRKCQTCKKQSKFYNKDQTPIFYDEIKKYECFQKEYIQKLGEL